jgi:hypothetical protein
LRVWHCGTIMAGLGVVSCSLQTHFTILWQLAALEIPSTAVNMFAFCRSSGSVPPKMRVHFDWTFERSVFEQTGLGDPVRDFLVLPGRV